MKALFNIAKRSFSDPIASVMTVCGAVGISIGIFVIVEEAAKMPESGGVITLAAAVVFFGGMMIYTFNTEPKEYDYVNPTLPNPKSLKRSVNNDLDRK